MGSIAYRDLSGVAHGGLGGLIGRLDEIASADDSTLMDLRLTLQADCRTWPPH
jgi:hypothetical protein